MAIREYLPGDEGYIVPGEPGAQGAIYCDHWLTIERGYPVAIVGLKDNGDHVFIHALVDANAPAITGRDLKKIAHSISGTVKSASRVDYDKGNRLLEFAGFKRIGEIQPLGIRMGVYELCRGLQ